MSGKSLPKSPTASEKFITPADKIISLLSFSHITEIPTVNDYRNPIVAEAMKEMKYVNMFNQGIRRVQDMLRENGNPEAEFSVDKLTAFEVIVRSTDMENLEKNANGGINGGIDDDDFVIIELTKIQKDIIDLIKADTSISVDQMAVKMAVKKRTLEREIAMMKQKGYISRNGSPRWGQWEIKIPLNCIIEIV